MKTISDLICLTKEIKGERQHGVEYSGMGTGHEVLVDELMEQGYKWPELNAVIHQAYDEADYAQ